MSTQPTFGHSFMAAPRNSSSGPVYSWAASETSSTASALGSADMVAAPCAEPSPPTPGRVDQHQPAGQQLARQPDLGVAQPGPAGRLAGLGDVLGQLRGRDLGPGRLAARRALPDQGDGGGLGVPHHGRHRGGDVVVDRAHRRVDQRVHQLALALLELADDQYPDVGVGQPLAGRLQPGSRDRVARRRSSPSAPGRPARPLPVPPPCRASSCSPGRVLHWPLSVTQRHRPRRPECPRVRRGRLSRQRKVTPSAAFS